MTVQLSKEIVARFQHYVDTFRENGGTLSTMLQLKLSHTRHVIRNSAEIMRLEEWTQTDFPLGETAALLHDIGRFSQFAEFGTYRDSESVDHAERGVAVIRQLDILRKCEGADARHLIEAVRWHNKKEVPAELDTFSAELTHLTRDADKLDIFRVMEEAVRDGSIARDPEITWGLSITEPPNPRLVESICNGEPVDYALIQSLSDFIMIQVGWVISGFHNISALRIAAERGVVEFRRTYLKSLTDSPGVDRCCNAARQVLDAALLQKRME